MLLAGFPATLSPDKTSSLTTDPAPMIASFLMTTGEITVEFDPINTLSSIMDLFLFLPSQFAIPFLAPHFTFSPITAPSIYDTCFDFEFFPFFDDFISTTFPITTFSPVEEDSLINENDPI